MFNQLSIGLDACWIQRGTKMRRQSTFQVSLHDQGTVTKEITAVYDVASISVPITFYMTRMNSGISLTPYLYPLPFCFRWDEDQQKPVFSHPVLTTTNHISTLSTTSSTQVLSSRFDAGVSAGMGLMLAIPTSGSDLMLKISEGCRQGLMNLATDSLKEEGVVILSQSLEASVTLLFQLKRPLHDACHTFRQQ